MDPECELNIHHYRVEALGFRVCGSGFRVQKSASQAGGRT